MNEFVSSHLSALPKSQAYALFCFPFPIALAFVNVSYIQIRSGGTIDRNRIPNKPKSTQTPGAERRKLDSQEDYTDSANQDGNEHEQITDSKRG